MTLPKSFFLINLTRSETVRQFFSKALKATSVMKISLSRVLEVTFSGKDPEIKQAFFKLMLNNGVILVSIH